MFWSEFRRKLAAKMMKTRRSNGGVVSAMASSGGDRFFSASSLGIRATSSSGVVLACMRRDNATLAESRRLRLLLGLSTVRHAENAPVAPPPELAALLPRGPEDSTGRAGAGRWLGLHWQPRSAAFAAGCHNSTTDARATQSLASRDESVARRRRKPLRQPRRRRDDATTPRRRRATPRRPRRRRATPRRRALQRRRATPRRQPATATRR